MDREAPRRLASLIFIPSPISPIVFDYEDLRVAGFECRESARPLLHHAREAAATSAAGMAAVPAFDTFRGSG
jgi:hypothetical protein